ncbi:hypothetical protein COBT_001179 [Conglomerata obtusa]
MLVYNLFLYAKIQGSCHTLTKRVPIHWHYIKEDELKYFGEVLCKENISTNSTINASVKEVSELIVPQKYSIKMEIGFAKGICVEFRRDTEYSSVYGKK